MSQVNRTWVIEIEYKTGRRVALGRYNEKASRDAHLRRLREDKGQPSTQSIAVIRTYEDTTTRVMVEEEFF